jgi:uncharacterized protein
MRVLFVTDLHSSTLLLQKALKATREFRIDLLIIGGDLSGKRVVPLLKEESGTYVALEPLHRTGIEGEGHVDSRAIQIPEVELWDYQQRLENKGLFWKITTPEEIEFLNRDPEAGKRLANGLALERMMLWAELVNDKLPKGSACVWTGGNDDESEMLSELTKRDLGRFQYVEGKRFDIGGYTILSMGYSNKTPFDTSRELSEEDLALKLDQMALGVESFERVILNVHVPPSGCGKLDLVPDINDPDNLIHVGSSAVRSFIETRRPLADFAGHVHEGQGTAMIGRTQIFNPGSDYSAGVLQGFIVRFAGGAIAEYVHVISSE